MSLLGSLGGVAASGISSVARTAAEPVTGGNAVGPVPGQQSGQGSFAQALDGEWSVGSVDAPEGAAAPSRPLGGVAHQLEKLGDLQSEGAAASRALATGQAADPESVVMAVERARLSMQLASQLRNKAVEAFTDIFHTQV
jgi:flagellar hook-basal body complex protein FliE